MKRRRKNPGHRAALLGIGLLRSLEILDPSTGRSGEIRIKNRWLAWDAGKKNFDICTVKRETDETLPPHVQAQHRRFHQAQPSGSPFVATRPEPVGTLREVGLVKALTYKVPQKVKSPGKNDNPEDVWHHAFGDTGHAGGDYPERVMPMLLRDSRGNLFFKRRKGNIFKVDQWLRG